MIFTVMVMFDGEVALSELSALLLATQYSRASHGAFLPAMASWSFAPNCVVRCRHMGRKVHRARKHTCCIVNEAARGVDCGLSSSLTRLTVCLQAEHWKSSWSCVATSLSTCDTDWPAVLASTSEAVRRAAADFGPAKSAAVHIASMGPLLGI